MAFQNKRHALGQHFLKDQSLAQKIAHHAWEEAHKQGCKALLEIGPGKGAITEPLLKDNTPPALSKKLILCEKDLELIKFWNTRQNPSFELLEGDFLHLAETSWLRPENLPLAVVSNLPYSSGTAILVRLARHPSQIPCLLLMFQAEVAQKLYAEPGSSKRGSLSVWIQNQWDVQKIFSVPPGAFSPPPKVNSEVVLLTARKTPRIPIPGDSRSEALWEQLLQLCFAHRRKMLRAGLPASGPWRKALHGSGVCETLRAQALGWEEWQKLWDQVFCLRENQSQ